MHTIRRSIECTQEMMVLSESSVSPVSSIENACPLKDSLSKCEVQPELILSRLMRVCCSLPPNPFLFQSVPGRFLICISN